MQLCALIRKISRMLFQLFSTLLSLLICQVLCYAPFLVSCSCPRVLLGQAEDKFSASVHEKGFTSEIDQVNWGPCGSHPKSSQAICSPRQYLMDGTLDIQNIVAGDVLNILGSCILWLPGEWIFRFGKTLRTLAVLVG